MKKIEKLYDQFLKEGKFLKEESITVRFFPLIIILGLILSFVILLCVYFILDKNKVDIRMQIGIFLVLLYFLLIFSEFLFSKRIEQYNSKINKKTNSKKFLELILNNNKKRKYKI